MQSKSMDWFLYDNGLRHERVKFKRNDVLRNEDFKSIPPYPWTYVEVTPLLIKSMTPQAYNNKVSLFPQYIWKQPLWVKYSD